EDYHNYQEKEHLQRMVEIASRLEKPPPVALLKLLSVESGKLIYSHKTAILFHQEKQPDGDITPVHFKVSTEESYDLLSLPLHFRWQVLYGTRGISVKQVSSSPVYEITVPGDTSLPQGRTTIALFANHGFLDSNPAIITIYRTYNLPNLRPVFFLPPEKTILPGEKVEYSLNAFDPEGFPLNFYRWSNEVGELRGNNFTWRCPKNTPDGSFPLHFIVSDGCAGNSYASGKTTIYVSSTVAEIICDKKEGKAPLTVRFSGEKSRDKEKRPTKFFWDFDDGSTSTEVSPVHTFSQPSFYQVSLRVTGPSGSHITKTIIHAEHHWPVAINCGWGPEGLDRSVWSPIDSNLSWPQVLQSSSGPYLRFYWKGQKIIQAGLQTVNKFSPPYYLEISYQHWLDGSQPGTGFAASGAFIGHLPEEKNLRLVALGLPRKQPGETWTVLPLATKVRFPWAYTQIKLYVTPEEKNPEKAKIRGWLHADKESRFFSLDGLENTPEPLKIISTAGDCRLEVFRYLLWTLQGNFQGPVIQVKSNGETLWEKMSQPLMEKTGCFLGTGISGKSIERFFTVLNSGRGELKLGEIFFAENKKGAFFIINQPRKMITLRESTDFSVRFKPEGPGWYSATLIIPSNDPVKPKFPLEIWAAAPH
ncbi:MAG: PKD domain-containing protein, partial [Candidatus Omnitrophica bacterium]|nr:PKD domain-containing protein [Candidatus Omnitrophota bacterium]